MKITKLTILEICGIVFTLIGSLVTAIVTGKKNEKTLEKLVNEKLANKQ
jgi:hypothetical protein